jgi:hypothetical protein
MAKKEKTNGNIEKLRSMALEYGCENNALFLKRDHILRFLLP